MFLQLYCVKACGSTANVIERSTRPNGLLCNSRRHPAVGISSATPSYSWIIPHLPQCGTNQFQIGHRIQIENSTHTHADTGQVNSTHSLHVLHSNAPSLSSATRYRWRVKVWTSSDNNVLDSVRCESVWSEWSTIVTAPFDGFQNTTQPIWTADKKAQFTLHRYVLPAFTSPVRSATAFVTAKQEAKLLGAYKLRINGVVAGIGPGRGDSPTDQTPYDSIDVTDFISGNLSHDGVVVLGLQCFSLSGNGAVLLEMHLEHENGEISIVATGGSSSSSSSSGWMSFDATEAYGSPNMSDEGSYNAPQENQDADLLPQEWSKPTFVPTSDWTPSHAVGGRAFQTYPKTTLSLNVTEKFQPSRLIQTSSTTWFVDFGTDFMGGLKIFVPSDQLPPRTKMIVTMSEELVGNVHNSTKLLYPMRTGNKYRSIFTTSSKGDSIFEHHEYMVFRYAEISIPGAAKLVAEKSVADGDDDDDVNDDANDDALAAPNAPFKLTAWIVQYPYYEGESSFHSSSNMLNQVWNLCEHTLRVTSLDTTTDSNTRERLPYEADGLITGMSRLSLQREYEWTRHSWTENIWNPTWPTEWRQTIGLFAQKDYHHTGSLQLFQSFSKIMSIETQAPCIDKNTNLVNFSKCARQTAGMGSGNELDLKDIVDWPEDSRDGYIMTDVNTVINAYAVGGLRALAALSNQAENGPTTTTTTKNVAKEIVRALEQQANDTAHALNTLSTNATTSLYDDGFLKGSMEPTGHSSFHAQIFPIAFGVLPPSRWPSALSFLRKKGMAGSVYSSFWALKAAYAMDTDHGMLALEWMTSCLINSWCHMLQVGATATMEAWSREEKPNLSWSHPWASAPASAVVWGLFGIVPTSPSFETFDCKPQTGYLKNGTIRVPTMRGMIDASFVAVHLEKTFTLTLAPPAGTTALVCLPSLGLSGTMLILDGKQMLGYSMRDYVCLGGVGSASEPRVIVRGGGK